MGSGIECVRVESEGSINLRSREIFPIKRRGFDPSLCNVPHPLLLQKGVRGHFWRASTFGFLWVAIRVSGLGFSFFFFFTYSVGDSSRDFSFGLCDHSCKACGVFFNITRWCILPPSISRFMLISYSFSFPLELEGHTGFKLPFPLYSLVQDPCSLA